MKYKRGDKVEARDPLDLRAPWRPGIIEYYELGYPEYTVRCDDGSMVQRETRDIRPRREAGASAT